ILGHQRTPEERIDPDSSYQQSGREDIADPCLLVDSGENREEGAEGDDAHGVAPDEEDPGGDGAIDEDVSEIPVGQEQDEEKQADDLPADDGSIDHLIAWVVGRPQGGAEEGDGDVA